jgi:hypothetical protein
MTMTRDEHLAWCKCRAHEYLAHGDIANALASMMSNLRKHPELEKHPGIELGAILLMSGNLSNQREAVRFIDGFK